VEALRINPDVPQPYVFDPRNGACVLLLVHAWTMTSAFHWVEKRESVTLAGATLSELR
jgi:hypothetical protein